MDLYEWSVSEIQREYNSSRNNIGWRFLTTSKRTLSKNSGVLLITLNPGGKEERYEHSSGSCEAGCAYLTEQWKQGFAPGNSPLQLQFQRLFAELARRNGVEDYRLLMETSVCGYYVPFRSPDLKRLHEPQTAFGLARRIWGRILSAVNPSLIICIDRKTHRNLRELLIELGFVDRRSREFPVGWGSYAATVDNFSGPSVPIQMLRLPHLSRFSIFGRPASAPYVERIFDALEPLDLA